MKDRDTYRRIWDAVKQIPRGRVATYGQIAQAAGFAKQARLAGYALHNLSAGSHVPWHRVINAQGRLSFPPGSASFREQKKRLQDEGIAFVGGRIDLERFRWRARSDAPVL